MKTLVLFAVLPFVQVAIAQSGSVSTAIEPALVPRATPVAVSVAGALNLTRSDSVSLRYVSGSTVLAGFGRSLVEFLPCCTLVGDIQAGASFGRRMLGAVVYGTGVATDLGDGYFVTYGLHVNKLAGGKMYPSVYVSLQKSFH